MKFELRAASFEDEFRKTIRLPDGKYDILKVSFKDIKSVNVYCETSVYENLRGEKREISTWYVDIKTLEDLLNLESEVNNKLIIDNEEIIIYDDHIE